MTSIRRGCTRLGIQGQTSGTYRSWSDSPGKQPWSKRWRCTSGRPWPKNTMIYLAKGVARWSRALKHENARRLVKLQNSTRWKDEWEFFCGFCERYWDECEGEKLWLIRKSVWAINI